MRACPHCHSKYPDGIDECPQDGAPLVALSSSAPRDPTESLAMVSGDDDAIPTNATRPESPHARARPTNPPESLADGSRPPQSQPRRPRGSDGPLPQESVGRVVGNYRMLELIGKGGMGWVYRAEHVRLGREVALKLLRPEYAQRRDSVARFFQEARAVNKIRHRNIVDITDFVEEEDGTTFIIMELLRGDNLKQLLDIPGAVPPPRALAVLIQICDALGAAHDVGIVHRDMKPDNVILVDVGGADLVKLLDFGVAKLLHQDEELGWETKAGSVIGTPAYMSPEQAGGLSVDGRSDVYSVGAIMYEMFCGQPVFRARSFGEYVRKHLNEAPIPPSQTPGGRGIDPRIEAIVMRCLQKSPDARYPSMRSLQQDLLAALGAFDTGIRPGVPTPTPGSYSYSHSHSHSQSGSVPRYSHSGMYSADLPSTRTEPVPRRSRVPVFAAGALALGLAAGVAFFVAAQGSDAPPPTAAAVPTAPSPDPTQARSRPIVIPMADDSASATPRRRPFSVRFTSDPSGASVYPPDARTALCTTPCDVTIDPGDGLPERREFTLRLRGVGGRSVIIDARDRPRAQHVSLRRDPDPAGDEQPVVERVEEEPPDDPPVDDPPVDDPPKPPTDRPIDPEDTLDPFGRR